ncbi:hypothetical protein ILYODFUR_038572 [Ilyodon furcidens]|uniref:Uncharacterized protein n=1 Tax=Ilyodon furcidens TaxID=33524 RepID=A0ABV0TRM2_9TELE
MAADVAPKPAPFSINDVFTDVQVTHDAMGANKPPYHHRCWLLNFALITIQIFLFLFGLKDEMFMISKRKFEMWTHQTTAQLLTLSVHLRRARNKRSQRRFWVLMNVFRFAW